MALSLILLPVLAEAADQQFAFHDYTAPTLGGNAWYGASMASSGDWLAVGAPGRGYDLRSDYVGGRVFLWKREAGTWKLRQVLRWPYGGPITERHFGHALAMDGGRLLVSTWQDEQVLAYRLLENHWVLDGRLTPQGPSSTGVGFGAAIVLQGDVAVIGSPQGTVGQVTKAGWVDVFQLQTTGWVHQTRLTDPSPRASASLGRTLALDGGFLFAGIQNHDLPSLTAAGKVVVFQNVGGAWAWSRDLLPPSAAMNGQFGYTLKVSDGRLFVPSSNPAKVSEFSISDGLTLASQTAAVGLYAVSGDLLVTGATYPKAADIFRRQPDQSWRLEKTVDANANFFASAHVKDGGVLIGSYPTGFAGIGKVDHLQKQTDGTWTEGTALSVVSADVLKKVAFGRCISASDTWLVVGAPLGYSRNGESGLVFIYRKRSDGWWVFHSLLPDAVSPDLHAGFLGARVALSGDLIAVGSSNDDDTNWPTSRVVMYRYHPASDAWKQDAVIQPPPGRSDQKFGLELALEGDLLAATCSMANPGVGLYRRTASGWEFETVLDGYYSAVSLDGGRLLAGSAQGNAAYVFEKKATGWVQTAKLLPPSLSGYPEFGSHVAISGTHIMVSGGVRSAAPAVPFERVGNKWQRQTPLTKPASWTSNAATCGLSGSVAVLSNIDQTALYLLNHGKWTEARSTLAPSSRVESVALHSGQLFTGSGSGHVWIQDLVKAPSFQVLSDYPQVYENTSSETFDAGEYLMGAEDLQFAVFKTLPLGIVPVKVDVSISGDTSEFKLSQTQFEIGINQEMQTKLRFKPLTVGTREVRVTFSPDMDGAGPVTYAFRVRVVAGKVPLQFTQQPASGFVFPVGNIENLECQVTGTRPWTFRWFKDGRQLPSANSRNLMLAPKSAGRYHVEVTNAAGTIRSQDSLIAYYVVKTPELATQPGGTARMEVSASGPGIQIQWEIEQGRWLPLTDSSDISGSRTPVLTVRHATDSSAYRALLTLQGPQGSEVMEALCFLSVVHPPVVQFEAQQISRGEPFASNVGVQFDGPYFSDPVIRVSGLPPGLTATPEGNVEGTPTTTGIYRVTISATLSGLTGTKVTVLTVTEPLLPPPGIYWGWLDENEDRVQKHAVVADLQPSGALSAVVHLGASRHPLAGMLQERNGMQSKRRLLPYRISGKPQNMWLVAEPGSRQLNLMALAPGDDETAAVLISELRLIKPHAENDVPAGLGKHSVGFLSRSSEGFAGPEGHGFGSMTVMGNRRVTYVGQMPDGTSLTGSSWLSSPAMESDATSRVYFYHADAATRTRLYGAVRLTSDVSTPNEITPESLEWMKLPGKGRILADGFDPAQISFITSRLQAPASRLMRPGATHFMSLSCPEIYLDLIPFQVSPKRQPLFGTGLINPVQARFDLYAPTGFLTGQFTLSDTDPLNPKRTITRQVHFGGMLLPEHGIGVGSFLVPSLPDPTAQPPTNLQTSPIVPGAVNIEFEDAASR